MLGKGEIARRREIAWQAMKDCRLCPRECGVNRTVGELGYCRVGAKSRCFREAAFNWEDSRIAPTHHVYFAGCNLRCTSCTVMEWNIEPDSVHEMDVDTLCEKMLKRKHKRVGMLNILGGEPAVNLYGALEMLEAVADGTMLVWHSNMYFGHVVRELLDGLVDVYLADFKCGNSYCADTMVSASDYVDVVEDNIKWAAGRSQVIVRHKIVPGHVNCCTKPMLQKVGAIKGVAVSLRYNPVPQVVSEVLEGDVTPSEVETARGYAEQFRVTLIE
jgi:putative pyruvate formate lyase activating enzyme